MNAVLQYIKNLVEESTKKHGVNLNCIYHTVTGRLYYEHAVVEVMPKDIILVTVFKCGKESHTYFNICDMEGAAKLVVIYSLSRISSLIRENINEMRAKFTRQTN